MYLTSCLIFKPGGFTGSKGTPNFLQSLDFYDTQVQWTESQIGGFQSATIRNRIAYTNVMDIQAGNWVAFGCYGGTTSALSSGAGSLTVQNCTDDLGNQHLVSSDSLLVTDGVNAEVFKAASVSYSGSTATITLGAAASQNTSSLLNAYPNGARVTRLQWQGMITGRKRTTDLSNIFEVLVSGMMWRYAKVIGDFDIVNTDSATSIYNLASMYAAQVPEVIVASANFAPANNITYSGSGKHATISSIISDILKTESGGAVPTTPNEATYWAFWVDELRQAHHGQIPTQNTSSATYTVDLVAKNPHGDVLGPVQPQDMDMTRLLNCVLVEGGKDSNGNVIDIVLTVKPSYQQWGYYEGYLSNPNITDKTALATWAAGQVGVLAWPQQTGKFDFVVGSARLTSRDLLEITGFDDGSTLITNPTQIQYTADMKTANVTGSVSITQQQPNFASVMKEIAGERSIRDREINNGTNLNQSYIVSGLQVSTNGLNWSSTAGSVVYNGTQYSIPAASGTMSADDTIRLGVQVSGTAPAGYTLPCVCPMPNFNTGVVRLNASEWFELQTPGSGSYLNLVKQTNFNGLYLATLSAGVSSISTSQRGLPWGGIDFSMSHANKILDSINDGPIFARIRGSHIAGGVAYNYKGVWSSTTAYVQGDEVVYGPSYWIALAASTNSAPSTGNANWQVVGTYSGYQGAWSSATAYVAGAEVTYNGNYWVCVTGNTNSAPSTSNANWQIAGPSSLDSIADGANRGAVLTSELNGNRVARLNDGTNVRTAGDVANTLRIGGGIDLSSNLHLNRVLDYVSDISPNLYPNSDTLSDSIFSGLVKANGGANGATDAEYTGTGSAIGSNAILARVVPVVMGKTYTPSFFIDPSQITNNNGSTPNIGTEFSGSTQNADGSYSNVDGKSSATKYTLTPGIPFTVSASIAKGAITGSARLIIGDTNNGYLIFFYNPNPPQQNEIVFEKYVNGVYTNLGSFFNEGAADTAFHNLSITAIPGSPNTFSISFDGVVLESGLTDASLNLASGTWPITIYTDGSAGKLKNYTINPQIALGINTADNLTQILQQYVALNTTTAGRYATSVWTCPTNLCPNSDSFAAWSKGGWTSGNAGPNGAASLSITAANADATLDNIAVTPGQYCTFSLWVNPSGANGTAQLKICTNGTFTAVATTNIGVGSASQRYSVSYLVPNGVTQIRLDFGTNSDSGTIIISQPMLEPASSASGYYISSQNPQVQVFAQLLSSAIVASGGKFKISQPMLRTDGVVTPYIADKLTYARPLSTRIVSGKPLIDFSENIHLNKHLGNIPDDSGSGRFAVANIDANRKAIIDFNSAHLNQGALSKKNQADLTADVTNVLPRANIHASIIDAIDASGNVLNLGGVADTSITPIANLMPRQAGADVTGSNTAADTSKVNGVAAATVQDGSNRANNALNSSADSFGSWVKSGTIHRLVIDESGTPGGYNLVYNPTFASGLSGWGTFDGGVFSWTTDGFGGGRLNVDTGTQSTARGELKNQFISVFAGQNIVVSGILEPFNIIGAGSFIRVDVLDGSTPVGGFQLSATASRQPFAFGPLQSTSGTLQLRCYAQVDGTTGSRVQGSFYKLQLEYGSQPSPFVDHLANANHNKVFNANAQATSSTFINPQGSVGVIGGAPASLPYTSTSNSITLNLPAVTVTRADQSTLSIPAYSYTFSGLSASHTCYVVAGINVSTGAWFTNLSAGGAFSGTQVVTQNVGVSGDGYIPVFVNDTATTAASGQTGGGSGGGGGPTCPAVWQLIETQERGFIRADEVEVGMHLRRIGGWAEVIDAVVLPAAIWRYTLEHDGETESFDVNDTHAVQQPNGEWLIVREMVGGEPVASERGMAAIREAHYLKDDYYVAFTVIGHEYLMGGAICHNATTY